MRFDYSEVKVFSLIILLLAFYPIHANAQELKRLEIPSSFNPVGSGAQALGMGGAFIAVADDATAASWNPGGLWQLDIDEPEASVVGGLVVREEDNRFAANPEANDSEVISFSALNYMSIAYPFPSVLGGRRLIVSANYQHLYDMHRSWRFPLQQSEEDLNIEQHVDYRQTGALTALGISFGTQLTKPNWPIIEKEWGIIGVGVTINFWDAGFNKNQWEQRTLQTGSGTLGNNAFEFTAAGRDRYTLSGINANIGIHWRSPEDYFAVGIVYKTALKADLEHESRFESDLRYPDNPSANTSTLPITRKTDERLEFPSTIGLGLAWKPNDSGNTVVTLDIYRTDWGDFVLEDKNGYRTSPISGKPIGEADIDPTYPVRFGFRQIFEIKKNNTPQYKVPLRLGLLYDPAPAEGNPDNFFGFTIGSGIDLTEQTKDDSEAPQNGRLRNLLMDFAYQLRFAHNAGTSILQNLGFEQDVSEHSLFTSLIIRF
jgi:hypothetical protein